MSYELRWYQRESCEAAWGHLCSQAGNPVIVLPTGAGKSLVIAELCRKAVQEYAGRAIVLAHRKELLQQNADKIRSLLPLGITCGLYSAGLRQYRDDDPIVVAGIQSAYKRAEQFGQRHLVLIDECVSGETLIATPNGNVSACNIRPGMKVLNAAGDGMVVAVKESVSYCMYRVELSNGNAVRCTGNHRFYSMSRYDWIRADCLEPGESLADIETVRELWGPIPSEDQHNKGTRKDTGSACVKKAMGIEQILLHSLRQTSFQSGRNRSSQGETEPKSKVVWNELQVSFWKREPVSDLCHVAAGSAGAGMECGSRHTNADSKRKRVSNLLQGGYRESNAYGGNRGGRIIAHNVWEEGTGQEKGCFVTAIRMEGVSNNKRGSSCVVYDLQVSGHPSFFANGTLVHNCHLMPHKGEGMYRTFIDRLREINPRLRMIGLTATPYRTGEGSVCRPDGLFQRICYDAPIPRLIEDGFLSPITNAAADATLDTSRLAVRGGEFVPGEVERLFDQLPHVASACREIVAKADDRRSVLVFCAGVAHARHVADMLEKLSGEPCGVVTGDTLPLERDCTLRRFKSRELRWLCNVDVLTTGFDAPCIDAIAILRATQSPGLFAQICGRGFRLYPGKTNCTILDFGENLKRHGPLDSISFGKLKAGGGDGSLPTKQCPNCEESVHAAARQCPECGWMFPPREPNHEASADGQSEVLAAPKEWIVEEVDMSRHKKRKVSLEHPDTLRVDYTCLPAGATGGNLERQVISEWVCFEHEGWPWRKAMAWLHKRTHAVPAENLPMIDGVIDLWKRGALAMPTRITTIKEKGFYRITHYELDEKPTEWSETAKAVEFEQEEATF